LPNGDVYVSPTGATRVEKKQTSLVQNIIEFITVIIDRICPLT